MTRKSIAWAWVSIACLSLAACSYHSNQADEEDTATPTAAGSVHGEDAVEYKPVRKKTDIVLPMDAYIESPKQAHINDSAVARLAADCMAGLGYEWPYEESPIDSSQAMNGGRYGVIDTSTARKWGYHPPESPDDSESGNAGDEAKQSSAEIEAYTGRSAKTGKTLKGGTGGCAGRARSQIFGKDGLKPTLQYLLSYHENSFVVAGRDAEVRRAMSDWSTCMKGFGHDYKDMWEVNNDPQWQSAKPTAEEKRIAEEDVTCKQRSEVLSTLLHIETSLQKSYIADHGKQFTEILKYKNSVDRRSRQVLS